MLLDDFKSRRRILVSVIFLTTLTSHLFLGLVIFRDFRSGYDETLYWEAGGYYVHGLLEGDLQVFRVNIEHPPLAKIAVGFIRLLLSRIGLDKPLPTNVRERYQDGQIIVQGIDVEAVPVASRVFSAFMLAFMSVFTFKLGCRMKDEKTGVLAWLLLLLTFFLSPYELVGLGQGEYRLLNGFRLEFAGRVFLFHPLTLACIAFTTASVYYFTDLQEKRNLIMSALFYGLATLSDFPALPALPATAFLWILYKKEELRKQLPTLASYVAIGVVMLYLGNPGLWGDNLQYFLQTSEAAGHLTFYPERILRAVFLEEGERIVAFDLMNLSIHTAGLYVEFPLLQIALFLTLHLCLRERRMTDLQVLTLLWFSSFFLLLSMNAKMTQWGMVNTWYSSYYFVPLSLYVGGTLRRNHQGRDETVSG